MGQKVVSDKVNQNNTRYIVTYEEEIVSGVFTVPDTNANLGSWLLDSLLSNLAVNWSVFNYVNFNSKTNGLMYYGLIHWY